MNFTNLFKIALKAIGANKMRSFLTMLGIIIGVGSVIVMLAIGQGSKLSIQKNIAEMGSNMIMIMPGEDRGPGGARLSADDMQSLTIEDYENIQNQAKYIAAVSPNVSNAGQAIFGNNNYSTSVTGVSQGYLEIRQLTVESGTMFTDAEIKTSAKVCVVGKTIVDNLFPEGADPIGQVIRFNKIPLRIVGVLKSKGYNSMGMDQDDIILCPYTTVMKRMLAQTYLQGIYASAITEGMTQLAISDLTSILRADHKLKSTDEDDFNIRSQE